MSVLCYESPAAEWLEALPIGNGFQGAMLFGGIDSERIQINDSTAWSGSPDSEQRQPVVSAQAGAAAISDARAALARADVHAADDAVRRLQHRHSQAFLPFADLRVTIGNVDGSPVAGETQRYRRQLDLASATHTVSYLRAGMQVTQSAFASNPDRVLVHHTAASMPVNVTVTVSSPLRSLRLPESSQRELALNSLAMALRLPSDVAPPHEDVQVPIEWDDRPGKSLRGAIVVGIRHNGSRVIKASDRHLTVVGATSVEFIISTSTNFHGIGRLPTGDSRTTVAEAESTVKEALRKTLSQLKGDQERDYSNIFGRVNWRTPLSPVDSISTRQRILLANKDDRRPLAVDPGLAPLLFDYGRYLLISASRQGSVPANLQGIWNEEMRAPWSSNYTVNINTQMNYWAADVANMPEVFPPLVALIEALCRNGTETARRLYAAPGWVAHHNTDIWAYTQPVGFGSHNPEWAFWPLAGPWLVRHLHEHLAFGARAFPSAEVFDRDVVWPITRSAAEFLLSWLVEDETGRLGTSPSTSPENRYVAGDGSSAAVAQSSTMDLSLAAELLRSLIATADRLSIQEDPVVGMARAALPRIAPIRAGRDGVREWAGDPVAVDPHHRHQSHLYSLYPGSGPLTADFEQRASLSLDRRGDESSGWSLAWRLALRARLADTGAISRLMALLFRDATGATGEWSGGLYPNLFAAHPPFQLDANFGWVAAVCELFVQSHRGEVSLLPAVPREFEPGRISGLVARPGIEVSVEWRHDENGDQRLVTAELLAIGERAFGHHTVSYRGHSIEVELGASVLMLTPESFE